LLGGFATRQMERQRLLWVAVAAVVGMLVLFQAVFGSWSLAFAVLLTLPISLAGGVIVAAASGATLSIGAVAGFLTVLGIAVRQAIVMINRYRDLRQDEGLDFGPGLALRGTRDRAAPILMVSIVTGLAVLPFAASGSRPGHEILNPMAMVILGGLVTATLYALCVVPALYSRFGTSAVPDAGEEEDLHAAHQMAV
jgi:Cu/Ag efflux pump CusA